MNLRSHFPEVVKKVVKEKAEKMDSLKKAAIREVRLSWGGGGSPPQKNFFLLLFVDFLFTQVNDHTKMSIMRKLISCQFHGIFRESWSSEYRHVFAHQFLAVLTHKKNQPISSLS